MRTPHVAPAAAYVSDERVQASHTIMINDDRDECGSVTCWTFPKGLPQSIGMAIIAKVDAAPGLIDSGPVVEVHACHREAFKAFLCDGKIVINTNGVALTRNELSGMYELEL